MIVKGNDVIGLTVFTVRSGEEIGKVKDIIYDPEENKVKALLIDEGGIFVDARVILIENVKSIGEDMVMIESEDDIDKASDVTEPIATIAKDSQYLINTKIVTEDGKELGTVSDIYFDPVSGQVIEFEIGTGIFGKLKSGTKRFKIEDILTFGKHATVVRGQTKQKTQEAQERIEQAARDAQRKLEEIKGSPRTQEIMNAIDEKAKQVQDKIQRTASHVQNKLRSTLNDMDTKRTIDKMEQKGIKARLKAKDASGDVKKTFEEKKDQIDSKMENAQDSLQHDQDRNEEFRSYGVLGGQSKYKPSRGIKVNNSGENGNEFETSDLGKLREEEKDKK